MKNLIFVFLVLSASVLAIDLDTARSKGWLVEQPNGYVKVIDSKVQALADEVNAKRKTHYQKIAKQTGAPIEAVQKQAAQKIQSKMK